MAVLCVPILLHFEQAPTIVAEMTGSSLMLSGNHRAALIFLIIFGVIGNNLFLHQCGSLSKEQLAKELRNLLLLMVLFFTTPLLVGFGIYFVLWHSLGSIFDQIKVVRGTDPSFGYKAYLRSTVPFSLIAFAGLGMFYYFFHSFFDKGQNLGALFIFVSVITVPHAMLMDWLYQVGRLVLLEQTPQMDTDAQTQELLKLSAVKD
jgi:Brp/Blh family beta-carotene 15,15'-monooxygenase